MHNYISVETVLLNVNGYIVDKLLSSLLFIVKRIPISCPKVGRANLPGVQQKENKYKLLNNDHVKAETL